MHWYFIGIINSQPTYFFFIIFIKVQMFFKQTRHKTASLLLLTCLIINLSLIQAVPSIQYVSTNILAPVPAYGSLMGGTTLYIKGSGFSTISNQNSIFIGPYPCIANADGAQDSLLVCRTTEFTDPNFKYGLATTVTVTTPESSPQTATCTISVCKFSYVGSYTPLLYQINPRSAYGDEQIKIWGVHRITDPGDGRSATMGQIQSLLIDGITCSLIDVVQQDTISSGSRDLIECNVYKDQDAGEYNFSETVNSGLMQNSVRTFQTSLFTGNNYTQRVVAKVDAMPFHQGGSLGQNIRLLGTGFAQNLTNFTCQVAGQQCQVTESTVTSITVSIPIQDLSNVNFGALPKDSSDAQTQQGQFLGSHGFRYTKYDITDMWKTTQNWITFLQQPSNGLTVLDDKLVTEVSSTQSQSSPYAQYWRGYFIAPTTGVYRFAGTGDDQFIVKFSQVQNSSNLANLQTLISQSQYSNQHFLPYWTGQGTTQVNITLSKGYYYMEAANLNYGGVGFFKLIVDTPQNGYVINPTWQVDKVQIIQNNLIPEIITVTVNNTALSASSNHSFNLYYQTVSSGIVSTYLCVFALGDTADQFSYKLSQSNMSALSNYNDVVTLQTVTDASLAITSYIYTITINNYRLNPVVPLTQTSAVKIAQTQNHSAAISGTYSLKIGTDVLSVWSTKLNADSPNISFDVNTYHLTEALNKYYSSSQINVVSLKGISNVDKITYFIQYVGVLGVPGELTVSDSILLLGGSNNTFTKTVTTLRWFSNRPFYSPIPMDFMKTAESTPQLYLTTNNIPIICQDCSYAFDSTKNAVVNSASLSSTTYTISVTDTASVGFTLSDVSVYLLGVQCKTLTGSLASFTCNFDTNTAGSPALPAGSATPQVHIAQIGYADVSALTSVTISSTVTSLSPASTGTNGGIKATLIGTGFPLDSTTSFSIVLCDNSVNNFISVSNQKIEFIIPKAVTACSGSTKSQLQFGGQNLTLTFTYDDAVTPQVTSLSTTSASPILKGQVTITGSQFTTTANTHVWLTQNGVQIYELGILSLTSTSIQCVLGGGKTGLYNVQIFDSTTGASTISANSEFRYEILVDSVSPTSGGLGGGYDITITGRNFASADSHTVFVGDAMNSICTIKSATATQIVCTVPRMDDTYTPSTALGVVVTGRILQESRCAGTCDFTFDQSPSMTNYVLVPSTLTYDAGTVVTINGDSTKGTNLTGAIVTVDGVSVNLTTSTQTSLSFAYPALTVGSYEIVIQTTLGSSVTNNFPLIQTSTKAWFATSVSSSTGSSQGQIISVQTNGLTSSRTDSKLYVYQICTGSNTQLKIVSAAPNKIEFQSIKAIGTNYQCKFNVTYGTLFKVYSYTYDFAKTPAVSIASNSGVYTLTRTNMTTTVYNTVIFEYLDSQGNPTSSVYAATLAADNTITPISGYLPNGQFRIRVHSNTYGYAVVSPSTFTKAWPSTPTATSVTSSFVGGQTLTISGAGFITSHPENNEVSVCGIRAAVRSATNSQLVLTVPPLVTTQTQQLYNLAKSSIIKGSVISDTPANALFVVDGVTKTVYSSANPTCYVGLNFGSNVFADISSIKYMPNPAWATASKYLSGAVFEGSNDSTTWTNIFSIDTSQVHSGWNYWMPSSAIQYQFVRFSHTSVSGCQLSDFVFQGIIYSKQSVTSGVDKQCNVVVKAPTTDITISNAVTYSHAATSTITGISPSFASSAGGDTVTITGTNFGTVTSDITVTIDGVVCSVSSTTATQIQCVTGYRASAPASGNSFVVTSQGNAVLLTVPPFLYIDRWSNQATWGGEAFPRQGDSVYVPVGMTLLVDVQATPILNTVLVEGKIKFSDEMDMTLDAHYFIINKGEFEAGTEANRYQHKLTITLHGGYYDKQLPIFGNKVLGCNNCKFSLHGQVRTPTWTLTANTVNVGATSLTVIEAVDWQVGQKIVIASSSFDHYESEQKTIASVSADNMTITVVEPFKFRHFSAVQTYAGKDFVMRAEVGLLTRNIKVQGNDQSVADRYGSHMMMNGKRDQGLVASFSYAEITNCGQPKIIGRYCTHFHMAGQMPESSVRGIAVHHSYARVLTIHGTHFLTVQKNVGYHVQGHNIFIQDGIETNNVIQDNLLISSITSLTLLQSDITVASIWVTNPYNTVQRNHAAGGDFYGIWYQVKDHPDGPSATSDICPMGMQIGVSRDNVAHSNLRFGLRIFKLRSAQYPCDPIFDQSLLDPYTANVPIQSVFDNYTLWKNKECGFLGEQLGYTTINNFKTIDSIKGGLQFHKTNFTKQLVIAQNSVVVGFSNGNAPADIDTDYNNARGLIASRTDGFKAINITFVNFGPTMTPLQSCSQCYHFKLWVVGSKTTQFAQITYVNITGNYIFWEKWRREVFMDLDGTLLKPLVDNISPAISAQTSGSITPYRPSVMVPSHCYHITGPVWNDTTYCDSTVTLRSILFTNAMPSIDFMSIDIKSHLLIDPYDNFSTLYLTDDDFSQQYMIVIKPSSMDIKSSWAMPFAVNQFYNIHWKLGIDFTHVAIAPSRLWKQTEGVVLRFNYTDNRELFQIGKWYQQHINLPYIDKSLAIINPTTCKNGDYFHDSDNKYLFVCVSGRNKTVRQWIDVNGIRCLNFCPQEPLEPGKQDFQRQWTNVTQWNLTDASNNPRLPVAGENITIPYQWNLVLNTNPPVLNYLDIKGDLIFDRAQDITLQAHYIWVSQGNITIGSQASPYIKKATIILHGQKDDNYLVIDPNASGNKMLANTGGLKFFGNPPKNVWTRLTTTAVMTSTTITVADDITGWKAQDKIVIAPSYDGQKQFEKVQIVSISGKTITFTPALQFEHYGAATATISNTYGVLDARSAVGLLTRNIRITNASDSNGWGCRVLNYGYLELPSDLINGKVKLKNGYLQWNGVELDGCGQYDTTNAGLKIDHVGFNDPSVLSPQVRAQYNGYAKTQINSSSIHACYGMCTWISDSKNVSLNNNVFFWARKFLVYVQRVDQYNFTNNLMIGARKRDELDSVLSGTNMVDDVSGYQQYTPIDYVNGQVIVSNNLVQGSQGEGFVFPFTTCDLIDSYNFHDNTAGSCLVGFAFQKLQGKQCLAAAKFTAYACQIGLMANPTGTHQRIIYQDSIFADNQRGITLRFAHQIDDNTMILRNSYFTGISRPTCTTCYSSSKLSYCNGGYAIRMFSATISGQQFPLVKKIQGHDVICTQQAFDFKSYFNNVTFQNYVYTNPTLPYCKQMSVFKRHDIASDGVASVYLTNSPCKNCEQKAWGSFQPPNVAWRGWFGGCGQFDCTGPNNYFIYDQDGSFTGSPSQILANNSMIGDYESACRAIPQINGHHCAMEDLAVLQYESIAPDFNLRIMWPVFLFYDGGNWTSKTNGWRQWHWNGPEPMNNRLARFWSVIKLHKTYNLTYSSQPPSDSRFQIQKRLDPTGNPNDWAIIRIYYPLPNSLQVLVKNSTGQDIIVKPFPIKQNVPVDLSLHTSVCGANNFHYQNGTIQFVVNGVQNCQVRVRLSSYVQLSARINIPIADFYANNGITTFITNICAFLGIDTGRLKIVGVKSGSTELTAVIQANASSLDNSTTSSVSQAATNANLQALASQAVAGMQSGAVDVGGPLISVSSSVVVLNPDGSVYTGQQSIQSNTLIIILAVIIPIIVIGVTVGVVCYLKRKRERVSSTQSISEQSFGSNQLKQYKRETIKVSQVPFELTKMGDTWYHQ